MIGGRRRLIDRLVQFFEEGTKSGREDSTDTGHDLHN
jgi:hypothetical protein